MVWGPLGCCAPVYLHWLIAWVIGMHMCMSMALLVPHLVALCTLISSIRAAALRLGMWAYFISCRSVRIHSNVG